LPYIIDIAGISFLPHIIDIAGTSISPESLDFHIGIFLYRRNFNIRVGYDMCLRS
jgi:hypothetical protein